MKIYPCKLGEDEKGLYILLNKKLIKKHKFKEGKEITITVGKL